MWHALFSVLAKRSAVIYYKVSASRSSRCLKVNFASPKTNDNSEHPAAMLFFCCSACRYSRPKLSLDPERPAVRHHTPISGSVTLSSLVFHLSLFSESTLLLTANLNVNLFLNRDIQFYVSRYLQYHDQARKVLYHPHPHGAAAVRYHQTFELRGVFRVEFSSFKRYDVL
jgi:hypothetical protein